MREAALGLALAASTGLFALRASADAGPEPSPDAIFAKGLDRYNAKDYAGAIAIWEELARRIGEDRAWRALYNLGLAYEASGDLAAAVARYDAFLARVGKETGTLPPDLEQRRQDAAERAHAIRASHGELRVAIPKNGVSVLVKIGGGAPREPGFTSFVAPGELTIAIEPRDPSSAVHARNAVVVLTAGQVTEVDTTLVAAEASPPPSTSSSVKPMPGLVSHFPTPWVVAGAGLTVAACALPIALGINAAKRRDDALVLGAGHTDYAAALSTYESARTAYYVSYAAPAAFGALTIVITIVGLGAHGEPQRAVSIAPFADAGLSARGRF